MNEVLILADIPDDENISDAPQETEEEHTPDFFNPSIESIGNSPISQYTIRTSEYAASRTHLMLSVDLGSPTHIDHILISTKKNLPKVSKKQTNTELHVKDNEQLRITRDIREEDDRSVKPTPSTVISMIISHKIMRKLATGKNPNLTSITSSSIIIENDDGLFEETNCLFLEQLKTLSEETSLNIHVILKKAIDIYQEKFGN